MSCKVAGSFLQAMSLAFHVGSWQFVEVDRGMPITFLHVPTVNELLRLPITNNDRYFRNSRKLKQKVTSQKVKKLKTKVTLHSACSMFDRVLALGRRVFTLGFKWVRRSRSHLDPGASHLDAGHIHQQLVSSLLVLSKQQKNHNALLDYSY